MTRKTGISKNLLRDAKEREAAGDEEKAIALYKRMVKADPLDTNAFQRLMILYRKRKDLVAELQIIRTAIKNLQSHALEEQQDWLKNNPKAASLAKSLGKSLGYLDSRGRPVHKEPLIDRWIKRKELVAEKIKKQRQQ